MATAANRAGARRAEGRRRRVTGGTSEQEERIAELDGEVRRVVVAGGGDQAAGAVGNGVVKRGIISATMGTSGVVFAHSDDVQIDPTGRVHTFCHAVRGKWHVMGVVLSAGGSLQWYRNQLAHAEIVDAGKFVPVTRS